MPGFLPQLVRFGFPTPYHFAVSRELSTSARIEVQKQYEGISKYIEHDPSDDWDAVRTKVTNAMSVSLFQDISEDDIKALEELFKKDIDLPPFGPSFITRVCGFDLDNHGFRFGQARRARSPQIAQALGALAVASGFRATNAA